MSRRDLRRIDGVFQAVIELPPEDRESYLVEVCNGDNFLYDEVTSLVSALEKDNGFLETPAVEDAFKIIAVTQQESFINQTIGPYKIISRLGKGGMGEVYLAEDTKLARKVALKFISPEFVGDNWARRQLIKEAQAVAMLDHPNICPVYGIEEFDEKIFIVMKYVEGTTLAELFKKSSLPIDRISLAQQIVGALAEAHAHGIIHRDIKPKNIMVTAAGQVQVLDFGLAKSVQHKKSFEASDDSISNLSDRTLIPGTIAYMSPEQLKGDRLDYLSDVFSVGTVLYEMSFGTNPFVRESDAETISAILSHTPTLPKRTSESQDSLGRVALKCIEKEKSHRYQSATELLIALQSRREPLAGSWKIGVRSFVLAAVIIAILMAIFFNIRKPDVSSLAILPFTNLTGEADNDYLSVIDRSLIDQLSFASGLNVLKETSVGGYKDQENDPVAAGSRLNVDAVMVGALVKQGSDVVLETKLIRTSDAAELWRTSAVIRPGDILRIQRDIASRVISSFRASLRTQAFGQTDDPDAYRLYLHGRSYWENGKMDNAVVAFKEATEKDPAFALAWSGLADSYAMQPTVAYGSISTDEAIPKARAAARRALAAGDSLAEPHISMGIIKLRYEWQWAEAESEFKRAIEIDPNIAAAHVWYASLLTVTQRFDEAISETQKAKDLDQFNPVAVMSLGRAYYRARQNEKAIQYLRDVLRQDPNNHQAEYILGYAYIKQGLLNDAVAIFEKIAVDRKWLAAAPLGYTYAKTGQSTKAKQILRDIEEQNNKTDPREKKIPAQERAIIYMGLGDLDNAFGWLEKAYNERFPSIIALTTDPIFDDLRGDARFADLARRINLTP